MSGSVEGKVVVVSGASMGVGRATAQRFAHEGATVVLLARRKLLLDEIADTLGPNAVIGSGVRFQTWPWQLMQTSAAGYPALAAVSTVMWQ